MVEFLLLLEKQARSKVLDLLVGHTDFGNQEVEQHYLHDKDVRDEQEPGYAHYSVLVVVVQ